MNQEFKKKWIEALRSGKYKQISGVLKKENGFCCLGVACNIIGSNEWKKDDAGVEMFREECRKLPKTIVNDIKLDGCWGTLPIICRDDSYNTLSDLNDAGFTFEQIADTIEYFL